MDKNLASNIIRISCPYPTTIVQNTSLALGMCCEKRV